MAQLAVATLGIAATAGGTGCVTDGAPLEGERATNVVIDAGVGDGRIDTPLAGFTPRARFVPLVARGVDSRTDFRVNSTTVTVGWSSVSFPPTNVGVPRNALGIVVNLTATNAAVPTHLYMCSSPCQNNGTSNINLVPGETVANMAMVAFPPSTGPDTSLTLIVVNPGQQPVSAIVDILGYFIADGAGSTEGFVVCDRRPHRVFDSRTSTGKIAAGGRITLHVGAPGSVAMLSVTVANAEAAGHISVLRNPTAPVETSTTNYAADDTRGNVTMAQLDGAGNATFFSAARTHLIIDRVGSLGRAGVACPAGSDLGPAGADVVIGPGTRLIDTRVPGAPTPAATTRLFVVPVAGTVGMLANLTSVNAVGDGYFFNDTSATSILNMRAGDTRANFAVFPVATTGTSSTFTLGNLSPSHFIVDPVGYLVPN